ncbi:hypothetical protein E1281_25985 [Actinomadura sp. KC345]|uniref:hypothetical protein n=1 Tax=Actinomadura sp. KC345 TaxID=2530371 RepID=UPI001049015E|nr:hypothetical protein [Actinomadura sp. KC345]TDC47654.1 hypothetical protein E1281_25985 [Actinomadura sp. KC345]
MTATDDRDLPALHARLAEILGKTVEEVEAMTREDIIEATARISFQGTGLEIANRFEAADDIHLMDEGPREQAARITERLTALHDREPLYPVTLQKVTADLFGFGRAQVHFVTQDGDDDGRPDAQYFLLSELAEPLGIPLHKAHEWAQREDVDALRAQRERDEERGFLGWDFMNDVIDLGVWLTVPDPEARPDADGKRWSTAGEWLVSDRRLLSLMTASPWSHEWFENSRPLFAHAMLASGLAAKLEDVPTYRTDDGEAVPTGDTLGDHIREDAAQMSVQEAVRRAMRGLDLGGE